MRSSLLEGSTVLQINGAYCNSLKEDDDPSEFMDRSDQCPFRATG